MEEKETLQIDIDKVVAGKINGKIRVPRFIINYLKKTIHQDQINEYLMKYHDLTGVKFAKAILSEMDIKYNVSGVENLETDGRYIFISNHPLGGLDGMILIAMIGTMYPSVRFVVNDLLMHIEPLKELFIPINKHGAFRQENAKLINEAYSSDAQILNFPAGLCSRKVKGEITDMPWKKSFIPKAIEYHRDIVPVYFEGRNSDFFYRLANFRKRIGIKFNIEMLYLPDEMFKQAGSTFNVYIGKPVPWGEVANRDVAGVGSGRTQMEWLKVFREMVYDLKK